MKLPICGALAVLLTVAAQLDLQVYADWVPAVGSGRDATGGWGKDPFDWTVGQDSVDELKAKIKAGGVYIRLRGKGEIKIDQDYWYVGPDTTIDGTFGEIMIRGPKGLYVQRVRNVIVKGICFKENETAVNVSAGGDNVWVDKCTFIKSAWGSPLAYSGWGCENKPYGNCEQFSRGLTISSNKFTDTSYGPLMFFGVGEATFYRNVWHRVTTRIPRAQNQGLFHVCNNVFDGWHLGMQGDDGARFIYERNLFNRRKDLTEIKSGATLANTMIANPNERIDICFRENEIRGDMTNSEVKDGPQGGVKVGCDGMGAPDWVTGTPCAPMTDALAQEIQAQAGAGDWCRAD